MLTSETQALALDRSEQNKPIAALEPNLPYISTGAFQSRSLRDVVALSLAHGFDRIELSSGMRYEAGLLEPVYASHGQPNRYLVHNYFPTPEKPFVLNLAAADEVGMQQSLELCKTAIALAAKLDAPFYSVHSGFAIQLTPELLGDPAAQAQLSQSAYSAYDAAYERFVGAIKILVAEAKAQGIRLLIENNVVSPIYLENHEGCNPFLMATAPEIIQLMQEVNDPTLGVLVDVGHANVSATALHFDRQKFIETLAPYIGGFHLSDNNGLADQNLMFDQTAWFCPLIRQFPDVIQVIEVYRLTVEEMTHQYRCLVDLLDA